MTNEVILQDMTILPDASLVVHYNISDLPIYFNKFHLSAFPGMQSQPYWTNELETIYVETGQMHVFISGEQFTLHDHEIMVINSGCVHYHAAIDKQDCIYYTCLTSEALFSQAESIKNKYITPLFHSVHPDYAIISGQTPYYESYRSLFKEIHVLMTQDSASTELMIIARFHEYMALLFETLKNNFFIPTLSNTQETENFQQMLSYIYRNYAKKISVDDIAAAGNVSRKQCYTIFHRYAGQTPSDYVTEYRLQISRQLLKNKSIPISQIASMCGFSHQSHFTNHFSKYFGITPKKYRDS